MIFELNRIIGLFRDCFSRKAAFDWFVVFIMGFMVRLDQHGVSSIIRWLAIEPTLYTSLTAFFRASSWKLNNMLKKWCSIVLDQCPAITIDGRYLLVGDGIKINKESEKMPGVKRLHQESSNSGKAPYIYGHHFGVIGILAGWVKKKIFCVPLCAELHEGVKALRELQDKAEPVVEGEAVVSVTSLMASMAATIAQNLDKCSLLVLDAYFAVGPVFQILKDVLDSKGIRLVHIITRAKSNAVGYEPPPPRSGRRGAPRKYGDKLKLIEQFELKRECFELISLDIYGQAKTLSFLCLDLFWKPIKDKVRFVLVADGDARFILMCSDLTLSPVDIIQAYSFRFKIEVNFKVLKHVMGIFYYHFWTTVWPKIGKLNESNLSTINDCLRSKKLVIQATNAIEGFVNFGIIATGMLQIISMNFNGVIWEKYSGWMRTISSSIPSEEVVRSVIQEEYFHNFSDFSNSAIYRIIMAKSRKTKTPGHIPERRAA